MGKQKTNWPKFKELTRLVITSGLDGDEGQLLEIAPTMKNIHHGGKRYFRLDQSRKQFPDGTWAALYLWEGYGEEMLRRSRENSQEFSSGTNGGQDDSNPAL